MKKYFLYLLTSLCFISCKKFLDAKPDKKLVVPSSINDLQGLLDANSRMNLNNAAMGEIAADNYFLPTSVWVALSPQERNAYLWEEDIYTSFPNDWSLVYDVVYYCNLALEHIEKMPRTQQNQAAWDNVKGSALFFRAKSFLQAATIWAKAYDENTASADLGIPLRLNSDFNLPSVRSNVLQTYNTIINDLENSVPLLPITPQHVMRPSKPAAYALLARTYLAMRRYDKAAMYADSSLKLYNTLLDFNTLNASATFPVPVFNPEVIMHSTMHTRYLNLSNTRARIDSVLYVSYAANDLRKAVFFRSYGDGTFAFKGSYNGSINLFNGVATGEVYLMRAECFARSGNVTDALNELNALLRKRWKTGTFIPLNASTPQAAISLVLTERRKELIFRDLRWMDIKRLNREGAGITPTRSINNQVYTLPPNDNRFALPLPNDVVNISGMQQNPR